METRSLPCHLTTLMTQRVEVNDFLVEFQPTRAMPREFSDWLKLALSAHPDIT